MRYTTRIIVPPRVRRSGMPGSPGAGPRPQAIGVRKSVGFGDPLGLATAAQVAVAAEHAEFVPFFAQHSARETAISGRTPLETLATVARVVGNARYRQPWGADADLLRTPQEVDEMASAGFTYFTLDLSEHVHDGVDQLSPEALTEAVDAMVADGDLPEDWASPYLGRAVELPDVERLILGTDALRRAAVKFGRAIQHGARMYETVARANRGRPYEIEISLDQIQSPVSTVEHLFIGLELESRGVRLTGLALRLDDRSPTGFETALREHVAVASFCGPYKLCFRSETYDPALVPVIGRCCGDLLHYKTSAESYLEALRLTWRLEPDLFRQIIASSGIAMDPNMGDPETHYVESHTGVRQLLQSVDTTLVSSLDRDGRSLKAALVALLEQHADVYQDLLVRRYDQLLESLNAG